MGAMKIRWKVVMMIAALFAALGVTAVFVAYDVLMPSFVSLEHREANVAMRRIQFALDRTFSQLSLSAGSWGNWTDAWRFAADHNQTFVREQVTRSGLKQLNINALVFVDPDGHFIASATVDLQTEQPIDLDFVNERRLNRDFPWRDGLRAGQLQHGFLQTNRGILLLASAPVLDGFSHGPARGSVIMGRLMSPSEIAAIGAQAQAEFTVLPASRANGSAGLVETDDLIQLYQPLSDIYGRPILTLRVDVPREITRRGHAAVRYALAYLMAAAILIVGVLIVVLNRTVLNPLARVTRHAVAIGEGAEITTRLNFRGNDEISLLAREFDKMVAQVVRLAYSDSLTGIPNREQAHSRLRAAMTAAQKAGRPLALMYIDLDNFKRINDTLGHNIGDEVLMTVADRLCKGARGAEDRKTALIPRERCDDVARLGGDEFMVILPGIDGSAGAAIVAERLIARLQAPMTLSGHTIVVTPSIGIAVAPGDGSNADVLLRNADLAMYFCKRRSPGTYAFFDASMNEGVLQRYTIESKLHGALERGELSLHYQPQVDMSTGDITGAEALLRWTHPELGIVPPSEFIPIAEASGLIIPIGEWVLRTACAQAKRWQDEGLVLPRISVNVASQQFAMHNFAAQVSSILTETGLTATVLELEITESTVMLEEARAAGVLEELHAIGVSVAIDDFGTGYSNFQRLRGMAIDRLKLDRSFIRNLSTDSNDRAIAAAILAMARALELDVVAEGVESLAQFRYLQEHHCGHCQGFLLSRALPAAEARLFLERASEEFDGTSTQWLLYLGQPKFDLSEPDLSVACG